jgi:hypothetical protein
VLTVFGAIFASQTATPSSRSFWKDFRKGGDGFRFGTVLYDNKTLSEYMGYVSEEKRADFTTPACSLVLSSYYSKRERQRRLDRMEAVKQLFHASINRLLAYNVPNHVGLVLFGDTATYTCPLTPLYEQFRSVVERTTTEGDTALYDSISLAAAKLAEWGKRHPEAKRRIVCLSDGKVAPVFFVVGVRAPLNAVTVCAFVCVCGMHAQDTNSKALAWEVAEKLQASGTVVDAIIIGKEHDPNLKGMAKCTGGYCFAPENLSDAVQLSELETYLNLCERKMPTAIKKITGSWSLREFS